MSGLQRLQKVMADCGVASRRRCEEIILDGRVVVDGSVVRKLGVHVDIAKNSILVDSRPLRAAQKSIYLFHKPYGVTSTVSDPHAEFTLAPYLQQLPERVFPIGRLDRDVVGLLLVTNDGEFAERLLHPRYVVPRTYLARVNGKVEPSSLRALLRGVCLEDGNAQAKQVSQAGSAEPYLALVGHPRRGESVLRITVAEGRKHFVKNLLKAVGHPVRALARISFAAYELGDLPPGKFKKTSFPFQ